MSRAVLEMISAFKSIHVLNDVLKSHDEAGRPRLKASHYACVLIGGPTPIWGIWTVAGRFVMFAGSRHQIAELYPEKAWSTVMASWLLTDAESDFKDIGKRVRALEERYGGHIERVPAPAAPAGNVPSSNAHRP